MDLPESEKEAAEFAEALENSFACNYNESVQESNRRLLMEFYSMGRRHERNKEKGPE